MKKTTLFLLAFIAGITLNAQITLTGSDSPDLIDGGVFCGAGNIQELDAFRSYVLTDFGIMEDFQINTIQYGAGGGSLAGAPAEGLTVTITVFTTDATFPTGTLTEIASTTDVLFDGDGGVLRDVAIDALIPAGSEVVILTAYPNDGVTNVTIGSGGLNVNGQISWIRSLGCLGNDDIVDLAGFGLTNAWTINAVGEEVLSVEDNVLSDNISLFPNPTNGDLNINFSRSFGAANVNVININGQVVLSSSIDAIGNNTIATSELATGVYFAQITTDNGVATKRFVKN